MWESAALAGLAATILFWADSLRARERALQALRRACERRGLQLLDETVAFVSIGLARDADGRLRIRRVYAFEFSETGDNRRPGSIAILGDAVAGLQLGPAQAR